MPRCAIYTRQSSVPHHGDTSCEFQFDACLSLVKARAGIAYPVNKEGRVLYAAARDTTALTLYAMEVL